MDKQPRVLRKVKKGNVIINFIEQTNSTADPEKYYYDLHKIIARLLVEDYKERLYEK